MSDLPPTEGESLPGGAGRSSTLFLTGDPGRDRSRMDALLGAIASVTESRDIERLLDDIVDRSVEVTGAERGILLLVGADGQLSPRVVRGRGGVGVAIDGDLRFSTTIARRVFEDGEAMRATVSSESEALELGRSVFDLKLRALMCVPLSGDAEEGGAPLGVLYVDSRAATRQFGRTDLAFFAALAQHISIALVNARLHVDSLEKIRLEQSLEIASAIQRDLMPSLPDRVGGFELGSAYRPAEKAGGDFFDLAELGDGRVAIVVGDVTGHGVGPALITASAQASLRAYLRLMNDVGAAVTQVGRDLQARMDSGRFLTLALVVIDAEGGFEVVNAGHGSPLVRRAATGKVEALAGGDPALGMIEDYEYGITARGRLEAGDHLVLCSDGVTEARHPDHRDRLLGEDGLAELLGMAADAPAGDLAADLVRAAIEFAGDTLEDDLTLIVLRRI